MSRLITPKIPDRTDLTPEAAARDKDRLRTLLTAAHRSEPDIKGVIHTILGYFKPSSEW